MSSLALVFLLLLVAGCGTKSPASSVAPTAAGDLNAVMATAQAALDAKAPLASPVASCMPYTGPKGSCAGTDPSVETAWVTRGSWATKKATAIQPQDASATDSCTSPQSTPLAALMIVFPLSKLLHAPGVFFSPSLNQVDDARERRHAAGWSARIVHVRQARGG